MFRKTLVVLMVLVTLVLSVVIVPSVFAAAPTSAVLAKGTLASLPDEDVIFRIVDLTLNPSDAPVTHMHGAGMVYAISGTHVLNINGSDTSVQAGQAAWVENQVSHTHGTDGQEATHFLFMYLWPISKKGAPMAPGFSNANIAFESTALKFADRKSLDVILTDNSYAAGADSGVQTTDSPTMFSVQSGKFTLEIGDTSLVMQTGDYVAVQAKTAVRMVADATAGGHVLTLSVTPSG